MSEVALIRGRAYIAGKWVETGTHLDVLDPATGERVGRVPRCGAEEARAAIDAASGVFEQWRSLSALDRAAPLHRMARTMERREEELATLLTREQGKPLAEARAEIRYAASFLTWFAEEARRMYGETIPAPSADRRVFVLRQAVGVGVAITPWNFPCAMITQKARAGARGRLPIDSQASRGDTTVRTGPRGHRGGSRYPRRRIQRLDRGSRRRRRISVPR